MWGNSKSSSVFILAGSARAAGGNTWTHPFQSWCSPSWAAPHERVRVVPATPWFSAFETRWNGQERNGETGAVTRIVLRADPLRERFDVVLLDAGALCTLFLGQRLETEDGTVLSGGQESIEKAGQGPAAVSGRRPSAPPAGSSRKELPSIPGSAPSRQTMTPGPRSTRTFPSHHPAPAQRGARDRRRQERVLKATPPLHDSLGDRRSLRTRAAHGFSRSPSPSS